MDIRRFVIDAPFSNKSTISYGLIVFAKDTGRWAITQRKHSIEFILYVRGCYRVTHLPFLLCNITQQECDQILNCVLSENYFKEFEKLYYSLDMDSRSFSYSFQRFRETRELLPELLCNLDLSENQLQWTWPKGRLDVSDLCPLDCAKREFREEVEIELPEPLFMSSSYFIDTFKSVARRTIESRYWIYVIQREIPMTVPQNNPEVSNRLWADTEFCRSVLCNKQLFDFVIRIAESNKN